MPRLSTLRPIRDRGFSFIELLAYMAIAALLILAAIPQFNAYRDKAAVSNLQSDLRNAATDMEANVTADGTYPASLPSSVRVSRGVQLSSRVTCPTPTNGP
ncbi:hypothetical protein GCM10025867_48990 (plasmid) [Frondihabitans sucicola]|uniref:Prepilin-type N-terminal cleavage/methylation domain-containing protein n=1 Tax=Frondihabitans sucicola TaxID=1268041 RepID=A0ABN6YAV0_9MICO|nr:prepilin-type N-terminal cleavage/methylation domain-containing protein [Frondihabitans sucicola]BDZ52658.1 hypothetical protein GCM10025867_48990 [Frondihabitans sucicola]